MEQVRVRGKGEYYPHNPSIQTPLGTRTSHHRNRNRCEVVVNGLVMEYQNSFRIRQ